MKSEIIYMLGVVGVGFAVNYMLRALPFLLFAGRGRTLPAWVTRMGDLVSPVIIALLIVYSYSGLAWKTAWPYLAGVLTVVLQVWRRNALLSIVVGTVCYMCLLTCGCASTTSLDLGAAHPAFAVTPEGCFCNEKRITPTEAVDLLEDLEVPKTRTIHILLDPEVKDLRPARILMNELAKAGYANPVLVTKRHAESQNLGKRPRKVQGPAPSRKIRYKKASEE